MRLAKIYGMIIVATALLGLNFQANAAAGAAALAEPVLTSIAAAGAAALAEPVVTSMCPSIIAEAFYCGASGHVVRDTEIFQIKKLICREKDDGILPEGAPNFYIRLTFKSVHSLTGHHLKPTGNAIIDRPISLEEALEFIEKNYKPIEFGAASSCPKEYSTGHATFFMCRNATGDLDIYAPSPYIFKGRFEPQYAIDAADRGITLVNHGIPVELSLEAFSLKVPN